MDKTLFELSDEILQLDEVLNQIPDEDVENQEAVLKGYMTTLNEDLSSKLESYCRYILELESRSDFRKNESKRVMVRSKVDENRANRLKEILKWYFRVHGLTSFETPLHRVSLCGNGGKLPMEILVPIEELPSEYVRQEFNLVVDTEHLRTDLEAGVVEIDGVRLGERGQSIRIK
jgi:hypothetical protein